MRRGFTLLEMLLASALSVLLFTSLTALLGTFQSRPDDRTVADEPAWIESVMHLLRCDLQTARRFTMSTHRLSLMRSVEQVGQLRAHSPLEVVDYYTLTIADRLWLVRESRAPLRTSSHSARLDLIARIDAISFSTLPAPEQAPPEANPSDARPPDARPSDANSPDSNFLEATLWTAADGTDWNVEIPGVVSVRIALPDGRVVERLVSTS